METGTILNIAPQHGWLENEAIKFKIAVRFWGGEGSIIDERNYDEACMTAILLRYVSLRKQERLFSSCKCRS